MSKRVLAMVLLAAFGCGKSMSGPTDPDDDTPVEGVTVMTRNLYVGTSLDPSDLAASPQTIPFVAADAFAAVMESMFAERAAAMALEIEAANPHVVALQEVSLLRTQSPGDFASGGTVPATDVALDFMTELLDALSDVGLNYSVASVIENADVEVPMITPNLTLDDVRITDYDALLVRDDVQVIDSDPANFDAMLHFAVESDTVFLRRGYAAITAEVEGEQYRFVSTHLEPGDVAIQQMQANELIDQFAAATAPVFLMGDFNSAAPTGPSYQDLTQAGYVDSWTLQDNPPAGLTCCQAADLRNDTSALTQRLDLIFVRLPGDFDPIEVPAADVVGEEPDDRTPSGLWPSDHAGVWATLVFRTSD